MSQEKNYAFEKLKQVLHQENCKEVVVIEMMKEFNLDLKSAEQYVEEAFNIWMDAYAE